jgi:hypothetical protein
MSSVLQLVLNTYMYVYCHYGLVLDVLGHCDLVMSGAIGVWCQMFNVPAALCQMSSAIAAKCWMSQATVPWRQIPSATRAWCQMSTDTASWWCWLS